MLGDLYKKCGSANIMKKNHTTLRLLAAIILCQSAGLVGSFFTFSQVNTWYKTLAQPSFAPPSWLFGPVWTTLYTFMGIALFLIWQSPKDKNRTRALVAFFIQLFLNAIWTPIFFGWHALGASVVVIALLLISILSTMILFYKIRPLAGYLLVPYFAWVGFASVLNVGIWGLN